MNEILDTAALVLVLIGGLLCITAAIGLLRFHDVPTRLHAATKPQVLGLILICLAIALSLRSWPVIAFLVPIVMMQLATAPLSAHMVGRQAYRNGTIDERSLYVDELDAARRTPPGAGGCAPADGAYPPPQPGGSGISEPHLWTDDAAASRRVTLEGSGAGRGTGG